MARKKGINREGVLVLEASGSMNREIVRVPAFEDCREFYLYPEEREGTLRAAANCVSWNGILTQPI